MSIDQRPPDDAELDAFLAGEHPVSKQYESSDDGPSAVLDAAILHQARKAVVPRQPLWFRPLAAAAMLVLCVGVVFRVSLDSQYRQNPETAKPDASMRSDDLRMHNEPQLKRSREMSHKESPESPAAIQAASPAVSAPAEPARQEEGRALGKVKPEKSDSTAYRDDRTGMRGAQLEEESFAATPAQPAERMQMQDRAVESAVAAEDSDTAIARNRAADKQGEDVFTEIRALIEADDNRAALDKLAAWREAHPHDPLPADIEQWKATASE